MPLPDASPLVLSDAEKNRLLRMSRHRSTPRGVLLRIEIVLAAAQGVANRAIARTLSSSVPTVLLWRKGYEADGLAGPLEDKPRSGRPRQITAEQETAKAASSPEPRAGDKDPARHSKRFPDDNAPSPNSAPPCPSFGANRDRQLTRARLRLILRHFQRKRLFQ